MRALLAAGANVATGQPIEGHPFVIKLLAHGVIDAQDLKALGRVLNRKVTVKKGQDIIVQGYEYNTLDFVESGFAFRYTLLRKGGRQIINAVLPGDIVGFPACFFERSIFSVTAATPMTCIEFPLRRLPTFAGKDPTSQSHSSRTQPVKHRYTPIIL